MAKYPSLFIGLRGDGPFDNGKAIHFLKIDERFFGSVRLGKKKAELRKNDRDFQERDAVVLIEVRKKKETGKFVIGEIEHILHDYDFKDMPEGYVMLSIRILYPDPMLARMLPSHS